MGCWQQAALGLDPARHKLAEGVATCLDVSFAQDRYAEGMETRMEPEDLEG